jgi:hypothetical protein
MTSFAEQPASSADQSLFSAPVTEALDTDPPTLVELIDVVRHQLNDANTAIPAATIIDLAPLMAVHARAVVLEDAVAAYHAESSAHAVEYLQVFRQMETLQDDCDAESREADKYAKRMHAAHEVIRIICAAAGDQVMNLPAEIQGKIMPVLRECLPQKGANAVNSIKPATFITAEVAKLAELGS